MELLGEFRISVENEFGNGVTLAYKKLCVYCDSCSLLILIQCVSRGYFGYSTTLAPECTIDWRRQFLVSVPSWRKSRLMLLPGMRDVSKGERHKRRLKRRKLYVVELSLAHNFKIFQI